MFFDAPFLATTADLRHRELLAEAENHRLVKLARAARRAARTERPSTPARAPAAPEPTPRDDDADRRCLVPR